MSTRCQACAMSKTKSSTTGGLDFCDSSGRCNTHWGLISLDIRDFLPSQTHNMWKQKWELACVDETAQPCSVVMDHICGLLELSTAGQPLSSRADR